jgi:hypothetical protein
VKEESVPLDQFAIGIRCGLLRIEMSSHSGAALFTKFRIEESEGFQGFHQGFDRQHLPAGVNRVTSTIGPESASYLHGLKVRWTNLFYGVPGTIHRHTG